MNTRDDFFYQAVIYAKEKNYSAARAMLRNLLYQYPDDIEGLLLYSIVAKHEKGAIQALKRILVIDPDHEIAFNKLAALKNTSRVSIPSPTVPLSIPSPDVRSVQQKVSADISRQKPLESRLKRTPNSSMANANVPSPTPPPATSRNRTPVTPPPEQVIERKTLEPSQMMTPQNSARVRRKKRNLVDIILVSLLVITCLCLTIAAGQRIMMFFVG